ncbi:MULTISPECIES: P-type DNA transfer ATPase VirB11 [Serratia]|mgnify:CR=1 FL=1|uniref:P-type DNA transfer ATPase VirB11 n=1 Tax=Serratia TaxID=613 RepID=UPI000F7ECC73|nr:MULTISPECIES: P-type DNA transfer ATPase VirB11 [Serratia]RTF23167.1 P-type DNA transfer ATPase VirB11 [Serratia marcescens]HDL6704449.1 P-type DNA transfer ATPase VirB11 [Yersinia enterocolitica]
MEKKINESLSYYQNQYFGDFLAMEGLTEVAVNRPGQIFTKIAGIWQEHESPITLDDCMAFSTALANANDDDISDLKPILSATTETGERCQVILPPTCERETVSITIRKPTLVNVEHQSYVANGFYNRVMGKENTQNHDDELLKLYQSGNIPLFMEKCVEYGKTMLIVGETGSGKTTYMKTLIGFIPLHLRITTIEDNPEIKFYKHKNYVHLFYPAEAGDKAIVTPASLVRSNYRMNPDRILLAEIRGGEAWDCLKIIGSGHEGIISSLHAGSPYEAIIGMVERCYQNTECQNMPYSVLLRKVLNSIDVVASIDINGNVRRMGEIYFKPVHREQYMKELGHGAI